MHNRECIRTETQEGKENPGHIWISHGDTNMNGIIQQGRVGLLIRSHRCVYLYKRVFRNLSLGMRFTKEGEQALERV